MKLTLSSISTMLGVIALIAAGVLYIAPKEDLCALESRVDRHIKSDRLKALQEQIWKMQSHWKCRDPNECYTSINSQYELDIYKDLVLEYDKLIRELKK